MERLLAHGFAPDDDPDAVMVLDAPDALPALLAPVTPDVRRVRNAISWMRSFRLNLDPGVAISAGSSSGWASIWKFLTI